MNMELIQVISAGVAFAASSIPLYFAIKVKHESQRILSSLLFVALLAYGFHSMLESFEIINYDFFAKVCFIISAFGLMVSYFIFQLKRFSCPHWWDIWNCNDGFICSVDGWRAL